MARFSAFLPVPMVRPSIEDPAATAALQEIVDLYRQSDAGDDTIERPLSGADVVEELGFWMERNQKLLRKLGIIEDPLDSEA